MTAVFSASRLVMPGETTPPAKLIGRRLTGPRGPQTIASMGERDAFGRERGEDALQDMGWRADLSGRPQPVKPPSVRRQPPKPEPASPRTEERPRPPAVAPRPPRVRRRRRRGFARLIFLLALIVVIAASAVQLLGAGRDTIGGGQISIAPPAQS